MDGIKENYPQEQIQGIVELMDLTNQQPFGDLEVEEMHITPEQLVECSHAG